MTDALFYPIGTTKACQYAVSYLHQAGISIVDHPTPDATHLLLDVPSFDSDGKLRGGETLQTILDMLPHNITIIGGNLNHPALTGYASLDLLTNAHYVAQNAAVTADCALKVAAPLLDSTLYDTPCLIVGWGRIGKCLGQLLNAIGTSVTIAARKETDRAMIQALGLTSVNYSQLPDVLPSYRLIFNTVPEMVLSKEILAFCRNCLKIDLASRDGMEGDDIVRARGLPGIYAPKTSGQLIAETILSLFREAST